MKAKQQEIAEVESLPDKQSFDDFETDSKFSVSEGPEIHGLNAHDLNTKPLKVDFEITRGGSPQVCLLILTESPKPEKVILKYEGITQEFVVSWNDWGWAPISLLKEYDIHARVSFEIAPSEEQSHMKIAKAYLRYQNITKTD